MAIKTDVLIIGAGPAGLAAAYELASRGLAVTLVDESATAGGQLVQQTQFISSLPHPFQPMRGFALAEALIERLSNLPVRYLLGHRMIGLYHDGSVGVTDETRVFPLQAQKIIVATGAAENAVAFPKWTLPGIMTIGAAQTLINRDFVKPGNHAVILGSSDFALDVALELADVGVNIKAIVEQQPALLARDEEKTAQVKRRGIPIYVNAVVKEARGKGEVAEVDIQHSQQVVTEQVDLVCLDGGRSPVLDVCYLLGCAFGYQQELGGWLPQYNSRLQTDCEDVFVAGNVTGVSTQGAVLATGMIAGVAVCEALQAIGKDEAERRRLALWNELERLETALFPDVWQARLRHVENFGRPLLKEPFIT